MLVTLTNMLPLVTTLYAAASLTTLTLAQYTPLVSRNYSYSDIPYKVDTVASGRGPQSGYNICNATTEGPESQCQTAFVNSLEDFCLWGLVEPNSTIGDSEAAAVAWCTKEGHGTRIIPPGAIKGAQFIQTEAYIQVTGKIDQTLINIAANDTGGEMDPAGEDKRGNPLGGLMYTEAFGNGTQQVTWWTNFMGGNIFCLKACIPGKNDSVNCEHVYDRIGCFVNIPSDGYFRDTFEQCQGDVALPVGVYYGEDGNRSTWYQPGEGESMGVLPYNATTLIPPTSSCSTPKTLPAAFYNTSVTYSSGLSSLASISSIPTASTIQTASSAPTTVPDNSVALSSVVQAAKSQTSAAFAVNPLSTLAVTFLVVTIALGL